MALYRTIPGPPKETAFTDEQLERYLAEVRRDALLEGAKLVCWMCKGNDPTILIKGVTHHNVKDKHDTKVIECHAWEIHEEIAADQPGPD